MYNLSHFAQCLLLSTLFEKELHFATNSLIFASQ